MEVKILEKSSFVVSYESTLHSLGKKALFFGVIISVFQGNSFFLCLFEVIYFFCFSDMLYPGFSFFSVFRGNVFFWIFVILRNPARILLETSSGSMWLSVLNPNLLFNTYLLPLAQIIQKVSYYNYADDTQLYTTTWQNLGKCIEPINEWISLYFLQLNKDKSEGLVFGAEAKRFKVSEQLQMIKLKTSVIVKLWIRRSATGLTLTEVLFSSWTQETRD